LEENDDDKKFKRFERRPNFDMRAKLSRDGRFWIIERVETWILPAQYLAVISQNHASEKTRAAHATPEGNRSKKGQRDADGNE